MPIRERTSSRLAKLTVIKLGAAFCFDLNYVSDSLKTAVFMDLSRGMDELELLH